MDALKQDIVIQAENLGKTYQLGRKQARYQTLRESISEFSLAPFRRLKSSLYGLAATEYGETIWALKNVSFEITKGEIVGVIGRNGAGKSTLLKILTSITEPTEGQAKISGRVGSLLEVGTGFHPELTGRENIYLNGAILGMKRIEINSRFDEIVAFAEIDRFIDTPIKHYSSGMYMRLAFAVAAHLETEVLLVDEVLAVGDAQFQRKCLSTMDNITKEGKTILFVSHNLNAIRMLCDRVILLNTGQVYSVGTPEHVLEKYYFDFAEPDKFVNIGDRTDREGDGRVKFTGLYWEDSSGERTDVLQSGNNYKLVLSYLCNVENIKEDVLVSILIKDNFDMPLIAHQTDFKNSNFKNIPSEGKFICHIPRLPLLSGQYSLNIYVGIDNKPCDVINDVSIISVTFGDYFGTGHIGRPEISKLLFDFEWELLPVNN